MKKISFFVLTFLFYYLDLVCNQSFKKNVGDFFKFFGLLFPSSELYIPNYFISLLVFTSIESKNSKFSNLIPHSFHAAELLEKDHALLENSPFFLQPLAGIYMAYHNEVELFLKENYYFLKKNIYIY